MKSLLPALLILLCSTSCFAHMMTCYKGVHIIYQHQVVNVSYTAAYLIFNEADTNHSILVFNPDCDLQLDIVKHVKK